MNFICNKSWLNSKNSLKTQMCLTGSSHQFAIFYFCLFLWFSFFFMSLWQKYTQEKEKHVGFKQAGWNKKAGLGNITG